MRAIILLPLALTCLLFFFLPTAQIHAQEYENEKALLEAHGVDPKAVKLGGEKKFLGTEDWYSYMKSRKWCAGSDCIKKLNPNFAVCMSRLMKAAEKAGKGKPYIIYGFRSHKQQESLYRKYKAGGPLAAKPGNSKHEYGIAIDITHKPSSLYEWMHKHQEEYGITNPVWNKGDKVHFQIGANCKGATDTIEVNKQLATTTTKLTKKEPEAANASEQVGSKGAEKNSDEKTHENLWQVEAEEEPNKKTPASTPNNERDTGGKIKDMKVAKAKSTPNQQVIQNISKAPQNSYRVASRFVQPRTSIAHPSLQLAASAAALGNKTTEEVTIKDVYGMNPDFVQCLASALLSSGALREDVHIVSGYRRKDTQADKHYMAEVKYGKEDAYKWAEHPNTSTHVNGIAVDLTFSSQKIKNWFYTNSRMFGLHFPYPHKPEHMVAYTSLCASHKKSPYGNLIDTNYEPNTMTLPDILDMIISKVPQINAEGTIAKYYKDNGNDTIENANAENNYYFIPWNTRYSTRSAVESDTAYREIQNFAELESGGSEPAITWWQIILQMLGFKF